MLKDINAITDLDAVVKATEASVNTEETTYSLDELHPEGDIVAEIIAARETKNYIIIEFETTEGLLTKFYPIIRPNGRVRLDPNMRYLLRAVGVPTNGFSLASLVGKIVTVTVDHYEKGDETYANIAKFH